SFYITPLSVRWLSYTLASSHQDRCSYRRSVSLINSLIVRLSRLASAWARFIISGGRVTDKVRVLLILSIIKHDLAILYFFFFWVPEACPAQPKGVSVAKTATKASGPAYGPQTFVRHIPTPNLLSS